MNSHTTASFRKMFAELPVEVQRQARRAYRTFRDNPNHSSLRFKPIHPTRPIYSARISSEYRAVGVLKGNDIVWYWIGSHSDYDKSFHNRVVDPNHWVEKDAVDRAAHPSR